MREPGLDERFHDPAGEICRKHGNTLMNTLRGIYGRGFATGFAFNAKLSEVLASLDDPSLNQLVRDHEAGTLENKIKRQSTPRG